MALPNNITKMSDTERDEFSSIAQANWGKAAGLLDYLNKSYPVGMMLFFEENQSNLPATPNPDYWQFAGLDAVVTNPNSPLFGQTLPDLRGKFIKHPESGQPCLVTDGANVINLLHNHGGVTGDANDIGGLNADDGNGDNVWAATGVHHHGIANDFGLINIEPRYRYLQVYIRIA